MTLTGNEDHRKRASRLRCTWRLRDQDGDFYSSYLDRDILIRNHQCREFLSFSLSLTVPLYTFRATPQLIRSPIVRHLKFHAAVVRISSAHDHEDIATAFDSIWNGRFSSRAVRAVSSAERKNTRKLQCPRLMHSNLSHRIFVFLKTYMVYGMWCTKYLKRIRIS